MPGQRVETGDGRLERAHVGGGGVRLDVGPGEDVGVPRAVDRGDVHALGLERLGHPGRAGEEVERRAGARGAADLAQDGDEAALRAEVLDHATVTPGFMGPSRGPTLRWGAMAPGDHGRIRTRLAPADPTSPPTGSSGTRAYEDPASNLSLRLRTVQAMVRQALDAVPPGHAGPIRDRQPVRRPGS